jgi:hypothetical protein
MSRYFITFFLFLSFSLQSVSQSTISDYSYVVVPDLFEFLSEKDQHQLNSMTKFLLNKYGCNAYFLEELPNVKRCDGLYADVIKSGGFIYTKLAVVIKDCNGFEIYRSLEGRSKLKDYKQSYYEALRGAFETFASLEVNQKDLIIYDDEISQNDKVINIEMKDVEKTEPVVGVAVATGATISNSTGPSNLPQAKYSNYSLNDSSYLLRKTSQGYSLYEETTLEEDGLLLMGKLTINDSKLEFTKNSGGDKLNASFDASSNLIIGIGYSMQVYKAIH